MKELKRLKLNAISKSSMEDREMSKIYGGVYCAFGDDNRSANEGSGTCSCYCANGYGVYDERSSWGSFDKYLD